MIVLDTNVISELMALEPSKQVVRWLDEQPSLDLFLSTVTIAEIRFGLASLPEGRRRRRLEETFTSYVDSSFEGRILSFDRAAAELYGLIAAHRRSIGRPLGTLDGQIAAIARSRGMAVSTRNVSDFEETGVTVVNPFD